MAHKVTLIPGDGSGPEVVAAAKRVVEATGVAIEWDEMEAGAAMIEKYGTPLPDHVIDSIRKNGVALKGPITTPGWQGLPQRKRSTAQNFLTFMQTCALPKPTPA